MAKTCRSGPRHIEWECAGRVCRDRFPIAHKGLLIMLGSAVSISVFVRDVSNSPCLVRSSTVSGDPAASVAITPGWDFDSLGSGMRTTRPAISTQAAGPHPAYQTICPVSVVTTDEAQHLQTRPSIEVVPVLVDFEVAVPRLMPALR